jgi:integrase
MRTLNKYILPHWRDRSFADIKRSDVAKLLDYIEDNHGPFVADAVLSILGSIATWFASRHDTYVPPFTRGMRRVATAARRRSRKLSDSELRNIWQATETAGVYGALVKTLLLTAQRRRKVVTMKWSDIGLDGTWTLPTARREKTNPGSLRLPEQALAVIHSQPRFVGSEYIFGRFSNFGRAKDRLDKASGVGGWTVHDLRRTARSLMSRAGVRPDIAERVLGHTIRGIEGVYDVFEYESEKADALQRLANLIEGIVNRSANDVLPVHEAQST